VLFPILIHSDIISCVFAIESLILILIKRRMEADPK
jgi:hypothetical protein